MNKKIIYSILILLSFCFIGNVSAEDTGVLWLQGTWGNKYQLTYYKSTNTLKTSSNTISLDEYPYALASTKWNGALYVSTKPFYYSEDKGYYTSGSGKFYTFNNSYGNMTSVNMSNFNEGETSANHDIINTDDNSIKVYTSDIFNTTPKINITKESVSSVTILDQEYITDMTVNIAFSFIDNDKYLYQYKFNDGLWTDKIMTDNNFSLKFKENGVLYVQILDKTTRKSITAATFTINQINYDNTPYITIDEYTTDNCIANDYTICKSLRINSHISDFGKYSFLVFDDTSGTCAKFDKQTINYPIYENKDIEVRIIENATGKIIDQKNYTISGIENDVSGLGQYIAKKCQFYNAESSYFCLYYIYNYDNSLYDYYYKESTTSYSEISNSLLDVVPTGNGAVIYKKKYTADDVVYFKIVEKNTGSIILEKSFVISFDEDLKEWLNSGDMGIIGNFINDHILSKLGFVFQIKNIITNFFAFDFDEDAKPPVFTFDLSFISLGPVTVEMKIDNDTRLKVHSLIKTFATLSVLFTFVKQMSSFTGRQKE